MPDSVTEKDVSVDVTLSGGGIVLINGSVPESYPVDIGYGTRVSLEAVPALGYQFSNWSGDVIGSGNHADVRVLTDKVITAHFSPHASEFTSDDEVLSIIIPEGTTALDEEGDLLTSLEFIVDETPPPPPEANIIGLPYNLEPGGATFDPPIIIIWSYDPADIPSGVAEEDLFLAYYDEDSGEWAVLSSEVDPVTSTITASVGHFTAFAIIGIAAPPTPAAFTTSSLSVAPVEVNIGEPVNISVLVTNTGEEAGSCTVSIKINGVIEGAGKITLAGGASQTLTFTTSRDEADTYSVDVDGLLGSFTVKKAPPWTALSKVNWVIFGPIIAVVVFLAILLAIRLRRRDFFG